MRFLFIALGITSLLACNAGNSSRQPDDPASDLETLMPGVWENVSLTITVESTMNTDSSYVMEVEKGEWEERMGFQPIRTTFDTSHRYESVYRSLQDSVLRRNRGIWNTFGDTLLLIEPDATYQYLVTPHPDGWLFSADLDWDGDGQADDRYEGVQKKLQ